jgi:hypothetical protein
MFPKAYRWVEEMRAIEEFVGAAFPESRFYEGAAGLFERLAREDAEQERGRSGSFLSDRQSASAVDIVGKAERSWRNALPNDSRSANNTPRES